MPVFRDPQHGFVATHSMVIPEADWEAAFAPAKPIQVSSRLLSHRCMPLQSTLDKQEAVQAETFVTRGDFDTSKVGSCYVEDFDRRELALCGAHFLELRLSCLSRAHSRCILCRNSMTALHWY